MRLRQRRACGDNTVANVYHIRALSPCAAAGLRKPNAVAFPIWSGHRAAMLFHAICWRTYVGTLDAIKSNRSKLAFPAEQLRGTIGASARWSCAHNKTMRTSAPRLLTGAMRYAEQWHKSVRCVTLRFTINSHHKLHNHISYSVSRRVRVVADLNKTPLAQTNSYTTRTHTHSCWYARTAQL